MRLFELFEAVGPNALYHGTHVNYVDSIIETDTVLAKTTHDAERLTAVNGFNRLIPHGFRKKELDKQKHKMYVKGVSLTRDIRFARKWSVAGWNVVLCFDRDRLLHNYRIIQYDYFRDRIGQAESEEFVIGPIENMSRYLTGIEISQNVFNEVLKKNKTQGSFGNLLHHPLLRIVGPSWNPITGKVRVA
jgi:hypothetical protein